MENQKLQHNLKVIEIGDEIKVAADDYLVQGLPVVPDYTYKSQHCGIPDTPRHRNIRIMTKDAGFACKMQPRDGSGLKEAVVILLVCVLSLTTQIAQAAYVDVVDGLSPVGYWRLGESEGTTATDYSSSHNGTYTGGTLGVSGVLGGDSDTAVYFDGVDDIVTIGPSVDLLLTGDISVSVWFKPTSFPMGSALEPLFTLSADAATSGTAKLAEIAVDKNGDIVYTHEYGDQGSGEQTYTFSTADLSADTWYNVTLIRDADVGVKEVYLYLDDSLLDTYDYTHQPEGYTEGTLYIGGYPGINYNGTIDEFAIFGAELTSQNVSDIYEAANPVPEPATIALLGLGSLALIHSRRR